MTSKDTGKVVTEQQYYGQTNREWMTQKTDRLMLRNDDSSSSSSHTVWTSFAKCFRPCSTRSALLGRHKRPAVPHSIHKTTLAISPELKECATRPQPVATLFPVGNTVKTEDSILELSLLLTSKKYNHIYRLKKKRVKINARGVGQERFGVVECSTHDLKR